MLKLIDTKTLHNITIDGTVFHVRLFNRRQYYNILVGVRETYPALIDPKVQPKKITEQDYAELNDLVCGVIDSIDGLEDIKDTVERLPLTNFIRLMMEMISLSNVDETEQKN